MLEENIGKAAKIIQQGGLVAFPTETVYGLGANALDPIAVAKIFELKERPSFDPLIVHIADFDQLKALTKDINDNVLRLAKVFWPGPLTIVLPKSNLVPDIVTSGLSTVGVRMPDNPIALQLIKTANRPIAAPSANKFGCLSPVHAKHVKKQLPGVDAILEGGHTKVGLESTIVSVEGNVCRLLRPGFISLRDIEKALPGTFIFEDSKSQSVLAPGLLKSHYSPKKPLYLIENNDLNLTEHTGIIAHLKKDELYSSQKVIYTSQTNDLVEVAANLFDALHQMEDDDSIKQIYVETVEEQGVGIAIMDRLRKATYQYKV